MPCNSTGFSQQVCLTIYYNIYSGALYAPSVVDCGPCGLGNELDFATGNLVIRVTLTVHYSVTITDTFGIDCAITNITLP